MTRTEQNVNECWDETQKNLIGMNTNTCVIVQTIGIVKNKPKRSVMTVSQEVTALALMMAGQRKPKKAGKTG